MRFPHIHLTALAATALLVFAPFHTQNNRTHAQKAQAGATVVFNVQKYEADAEVMLDPIVLIEGGRFTAPPTGNGDYQDEAAEAKMAERFIKDYYRVGRKYRLLFGGGEVGSVEVLKYIEPGCVGMEASARAETTAKLGGQVMALATNADKLGRKTGTRRAPTEAERSSALELARKAFARNRVAAARIKRMETNNLTAVDLNGDGAAELVGSFVITGDGGVEDALFIIAEPSRGSFSDTLAWYQHGQEADSSYRRLVDVVDLDGDGTLEILAQGIYYESHDYMIYKKQGKAWRMVYQGGGGGC